MKTNILIPFFVLFIAVSSYGKVKVTELPPKAFSAMLKISAKAKIIDVQTAEQFVQAHIVGALPAPEKKDLLKIVDTPTKETKIFIYCREGARSLEAANQLIKKGYIFVYSLKGGLLAWDEGGYPLELNK